MAENENRRNQSQASLILNLDTIKRPESIYKNIFQTKPDSLNHFSHFSYTNRLSKSQSMLSLFGIKPAQLSLLTPNIKLYKVFYDGLDYNKQISWQIPFDDYLGASKISEDSISLLTTTHKGKGNGVGIKSFEYAYEGVNQAEVNTNITAKLSLYFSNIDDLVKIIHILPNDPNYLETNSEQNKIERNFKYSDLVNQESRYLDVDRDNAGTSFNSNYYRIKVVCGYGDVTLQMLKNIGIKNNIEQLHRAIKDVKIILYLIPHLHEINYLENGAVELTINYNAVIDRNLYNSELDIFKISDKYNEYKEVQNKIIKINNSIGKQNQINSICLGQNKTSLEELSDNLKKIHSKLTLKLKEKQNNIYSNVFQELIKNELIYEAQVDVRYLGLDTSGFWVAQEEKTEAGDVKKLRDQAQIKTIFYKMEALRFDNTLNKILKNIDEEKTATIDSPYVHETYIERIPFFFLGDLIDSACKVLNTEYKNKEIDRPRIILGNILIPNKEQLLSNEPITSNSSLQAYNLGDIPISLALFSEFFNNKVLSSNRDYYPLGAFIKDLVTDLVIPALNPTAFGNSIKNLSNRVSVFTFNHPIDYSNIDSLTGHPIDVVGGIIKTNGLSEIENSLFLEEKLSNQCLSYYFIYVSSQLKMKFLKESENIEEQNTKNGIFHFRIGTDSGIIKSISFKKTDNPYYREAKVLNEGNSDSIRLKQVYNADIVMYGNNIYRPGDYIYIEPDIYSIRLNEDLKSAGDVLGLGGYYFVTKVSTKMNMYNFETNLETLYQSSMGESINNGNTIKDCSADIKELQKLTEEEFKDVLQEIQSTSEKELEKHTNWWQYKVDHI